MHVNEPSSWIAPIIVVYKEKAIRLCIDPTQLNSTMQCCVNNAGPCGSLFKLDCNNEYHQTWLSAESMLLTIFTMPFGRYTYKRLPFGISSGNNEQFQKRMNIILEGLWVCTVFDRWYTGLWQRLGWTWLVSSSVLQCLRNANVIEQQMYLLTNVHTIHRSSDLSW